MITIAIKVDVNTYAGTRDGVPRLLDIFQKTGIQATFFFSMGPDNSGKAIRRIFTHQGYLRKMLKKDTPKSYSFKTMLYGILLPPPMIASSFPYILKSTEHMGHEVGIHGWDHVKWHDLLPWIPKNMVAMELGRACAVYEDILGHRARSTAAPGWAISENSLEIQDAMYLTYCSDTRGTAPFYPVIDGRRFNTLQIPTTLPTMDELLGENNINSRNVNDLYLKLLRPGLNVHTIQAELEGKDLASIFARLLERLKDMNVHFVTLADAATDYMKNAPDDSVGMGKMPGRTGHVAIQGLQEMPTIG